MQLMKIRAFSFFLFLAPIGPVFGRINKCWLVGALPPHPRTVDLKVSEKSAFGPPRGCASGSLWVVTMVTNHR